MAQITSPSEWTIMFYFASDNALSPLIVSQLKGIKDAGFQQETNVLVHFDPNQPGEPTKVFNVNALARNNLKKELKKSRSGNGKRATRIGDGKDPFVRDMREDEVPEKTINASVGPPQSRATKTGEQSLEEDAESSLTRFLMFCRNNYRAKHYVLFLIGHGMIVGNDAFLPDEDPVSAITLEKLDSIVRGFADTVRYDGDVFELLALHSCSMSSVEVAYQLKDTARYMIASQGLSFVGSWPYRQLLKRTFNAIEDKFLAKTSSPPSSKAKDDDGVPALIESIYSLSLRNVVDFMLAGYSGDLAMCKLTKEDLLKLKVPLQNLVAKLKEALNDKSGRCKELILLAHWKSQSFWQEMYTDLFDFCHCLHDSCDEKNALQKSVKQACTAMIKRLKRLVIHAENFGSQYQYSHGLSIYFPWTEPVEDKAEGTLKKYANYAFNTEFEKDSSWFSFLEQYFEKTRRDSRDKEDGTAQPENERARAAVRSFIPFGGLAIDKPTPSFAGGSDKPTPSTGVGCSCPSIKNYPKRDTPPGKRQTNVKEPLLTKGVFRAAFKN